MQCHYAAAKRAKDTVYLRRYGCKVKSMTIKPKSRFVDINLFEIIGAEPRLEGIQNPIFP